MLIIRKAIPTDAPSIIDFQLRMALETEELALVPEIVAKGVNSVFDNKACGQYWIAENDGEVISSLLITYEWSDWRNSNVWWFQSVYVLPGHRRKGVFRSMYRKIREEAEHQDVAGLRLYVETDNTAAQKTYEALGMQCQHYKMYEWLKQ